MRLPATRCSWIGIGTGAVVAGRLSRKHVEIGLVPLGSVGITIFSLLVARSGAGRVAPISRCRSIPHRAHAARIRRGIFHHPTERDAATTGAHGNEGTPGGVFQCVELRRRADGGGVPGLLTSALGVSIHRVIFFVAILTLGGTIYVVRMLPDFTVRLLIWIFTNTIYRIRTVGDENLPKEGALLVANHVSWSMRSSSPRRPAGWCAS